MEHYAMCGNAVSYCSLRYLIAKKRFPLNGAFFPIYKKTVFSLTSGNI